MSSLPHSMLIIIRKIYCTLLCCICDFLWNLGSSIIEQLYVVNYLNKSKEISLWWDCWELASSNINWRNSGHKLFPSSSIKFRETSATRSAIFFRMALWCSFCNKVRIWDLNWAFCSSGNFLKNSWNSEDNSLLNITAANWRPSSGISPPGGKDAKRRLAFWSNGRLS